MSTESNANSVSDNENVEQVVALEANFPSDSWRFSVFYQKVKTVKTSCSNLWCSVVVLWFILPSCTLKSALVSAAVAVAIGRPAATESRGEQIISVTLSKLLHMWLDGGSGKRSESHSRADAIVER